MAVRTTLALAAVLGGHSLARAQASTPSWQSAPSEGASLAWLGAASEATPASWSGSDSEAAAAPWRGLADDGQLPPGWRDWSSRDPQRRAERAFTDAALRPKPILGIGGGVRIGSFGGTSTGEPTSGMLSGRLGHELSSSVALSLRPSLIFGNVDLKGQRNNQSEFQLPLTLDLFPRAVISPYIGGGIVNNADSTGVTDGMLSGGVDININRHLTLGFTVNRIFQNRLNDNDWEAMTQLYVRY